MMYETYRQEIENILRNTQIGKLITFNDYDNESIQHSIRDLVPYTEIIAGKYYYVYDTIGIEWEREPPKSKYLIFIPNKNTSEEALKALNSLQEYLGSAVIIDYTENTVWPSMISVAKVVNKNISFTQIQNWIQKQARKYLLEYFYFLHSDALVTPNTFIRLHSFMVDNPTWDIIHTNYDALVAFKTESNYKFGVWDETFSWYVSDVDFYNRAKWRGCNFLTCTNAEVMHENPSSTMRSLSSEESTRVQKDHAYGVDHYLHKWGYDFRNSTGIPYKTPYGVE